MGCGAGVGVAGSAAVTATGTGAGIGAGEADAMTVGAAWPGGAQPGGGTKALLGSAARGGATSATIGAGVATMGVGVATIGAGADGSAIVVTTAAGGGATGIVTGATDATLGAAGWPGGAQPGGGMNALLGSAGGAGAAGGATGSGTIAGTIAGAGAAAGGVAAGSATGGGGTATTGAGAGPDAGSPAIGGVPFLEPSGGALLLASFSAAVRAWRCSRAFASRSSASFSMASFWAFWPPLPATMEPTCGPVRVSSTGAMPASYWRPELAEGRLELAVTEASAPGRAFALGTGALPPNIPQPDRSANADTPTKPNHRPRPPIVCCSLCIVVTRLKPDSLIVSGGSREEI